MLSKRWFASGLTKFMWIFNTPIFALLSVAVIEGSNRFALHIPSPAPILLLVVLYIALHSTRRETFIGAFIVWVYLIYFFNFSPQSVRYAPDNLTRTIIWSMVLPTLVTLVRRLRGQLDREIAECKQQDGKFRALLESAPDAMVIVNEQGIIQLVNVQAEKLFGYTRVELIGSSVERLVPPSSRGIHTQHREIYKGNAQLRPMGADMELYGLHKDGHQFPVEISLSPIETEDGRLICSNVRDVTAYRQAEEALLEERNLLKILMDNIPDAIYFKDRQSRFIRINRYHAQMLGFASPEEAYGKSDFDVHSPEFAQYTRASEQRIIETGEPIIDQVELDPSFKGESRWFSVTKVPHYDQSGQVVGIIGVSRNITERKQIENLLRTQEEFLRQIIDNAPNMIFVKDWDGRFLLVNQAFAQFNGVTAEQAIGKTDLALGIDEKQVEGFLRDDREVMTRHQNKLIAQEAVSNAQGERHWFQTMKVPLIGADGKSTRVLGVATDITARKEAEAALESQHNLLRTLIENIPDLIDVKNTESRFIIANPPVLQLLGVSKPDDLIGKSDFDFLPGEQARRWYEIEQSIMQSGESLFNVEEQVVSQSTGQIRWLLVTKVPLRDGNGAVTGIITINRDITDRKQAENALVESEERYRIISEMISDYAFSFSIQPDGTPELDWITEESFKRVTGYTPDDVRAGSWFMFDLPDQKPIQAEWERTIHGEATDAEHVLITKDGRRRWLHIYRQPVWNEDHTRVIQVYGVSRDVTERKEAEKALIESEERYRMISEMISDYAFAARVEPDGQVVVNWVAGSITAITGYTQNDFLDGSKNFILYHPDYDEKARIDVQKVLEGSTVDTEYQIVSKSGAVLWVRMIRRPVWDEAHEHVIGLYAGVQNITARKRAEEALKISEERHRIISEIISDYASAFRVEKDGTIIMEWSTGSVNRVTGYTMDEYEATLGTGIYQDDETFVEYHPDDRDRVKADVTKTLSGIRSDGEYRMFRKNGEIYWVHVYRYPVWDEAEQRVVRYYAVDQDITERKEAEEALRQSEERYRIISELVTDNVFSLRVHPDGSLTQEWVMGSFTKLTGYGEAEIGGTYKLYHPDDAARAAADVQAVIAGQAVSGEYRVIPKEGEILWVEIRRFPIWDEREKRVVRFIGAARDITARKQAESQQLEMRLQSEKLEITRNFLGQVAHDFRTPLSIMKTSLYLVRKSPDQDKRNHHMDTLDVQISHIQRLLEDIFTLTRLDLGAAEFQFDHCNINSVVKELYAHYQTRAAQNQCEITLNLDPKLPLVRADRGELITALRHLVTNALSYTPKGGLIRLETHVDAGCVRIEIRDSGIGINEEDRQHIFERFYRADKARSVNTGGTGLGLSIVQRIVEAHNGSVEVESQVGEGSTFSILLPILTAAPERG